MYRYIGNKTSVISKIAPIIDEVAPEGGTVADPMCGTASVSEALRLRGYQVVAADIMTFAYYHAIVRLKLGEAPEFEKIPVVDGYVDVLSTLQSLKPVKGFFYKEFSPKGKPENGCSPRKYFTSRNAKKIDAVRKKLNDWRDKNLLEEEEKALLHHDLIMAVNKVANIAGTYGHYRSKWNTAAKRPLQFEPTRFMYPDVRTDHTVFLGPVEKVSAKIEADVCYLDPPYKKRQYAANYHILETLARGDRPAAVGKSGLREWRDQHSGFCSKRKIGSSFASVIEKMDCNKFLVSYSEDGLVSKSRLRSILEEFGSVDIRHFSNTRFKSNDSDLDPELTEFVFFLET
jgi:adenine-specific DNA-methyltransferase